MPDASCAFFLSYAREDAHNNRYFERFYGELERELHLRTGQPFSEPIVFRDTEHIDPGQPWPDRLRDVLCTCKIFLSIHSPLYYQSETCGKEWQFFRNRLEEHARLCGEPVPHLIIPIHWIPLPPGYEQLPQTVTNIHYWHPKLTTSASPEGLYRLLRLGRPQYKKALDELVDTLLQLRQHATPTTGSAESLLQTPSAFHVKNESAASRPAERPGLGHVQFAILAGHRAEMEAARSITDAYGDTPGDWCPYSLPARKKIGVITQLIAQGQNFTSGFLDLDRSPDLREKLDRARDQNNVVVFLIDPWTLKLRRYQDKADIYDRTDGYNRALLIPWPDDKETLGSREDLQESVFLAFPTKSRRQDETFRGDIESLERLESELRDVIVKTSSRILEVAQNVRRAEGDQIIPKPRISGPFGN